MHRTKKLIVTATAAALLMAGGVSSAMADHKPGHAGKMTICHRTGSASNPYVKITISENAWDAHQRHPAKDGREDFIPTTARDCERTNNPPPPHEEHGEDCTASSGSGDTTQSQHGLVNVGNINLGVNNLLANWFCHSNLLNGLAVAGIGDAFGGSVGSGSGDGDCFAESFSGDSSQHQHGLVNVGNVNLGVNNLLANWFCHSNLLNGVAVAGIGDAFGGDVLSHSGSGDCIDRSLSGDSAQDRNDAVNVGNLNLSANNRLANAFCGADVLHGRAISLIGSAVGGSTLDSGLLSGPAGILGGAPGYLLSGITTDVRVLANVLVQF